MLSIGQSTNLIEVDGLEVTFSTPGGTVPALRGVSFRVRPASSVAIVGESGSGKSVTAQAIMGLLPRPARIDAGRIQFRDPLRNTTEDLTKLDPRSKHYRQIRGGRISIIFQEPMTALFPLHQIGVQIQEALELHEDISGEAARRHVIDMLKLVRFPDPERGYKSYPFELSGGLRQRAMIAMALVCRPALLIADEPTTALDVTVQAQVLGLIKDLQRELGMALLLITHDMGVVANVADEVVVMYRGQVMESGMAEDIFRNPQHPYLVALMRAVPRIDADASQRLVPIGAAWGGDKEQAPRPRPVCPAGAPPLIEVEHLFKSFTIKSESFGFKATKAKTLLAIDNVSFTIRRGECLGLVGESGCGKTTASKMIMGAVQPDAGSILYHDEGQVTELAGLSDKALRPYRRHIQYMFQDPFSSLDPRMTVLDLVAEPLKIQGIGTTATRRKRVQELLRLVGLDPRFLNRYPHSFSGGQRQRIGIARALALEPRMLILDEPVSALDVSTQAQVLNLLNDLRDKLGLTYLFIAHNLAVVNYVADRVAVMCCGRIVELAPRRELFNNPRHPYTKTLLASSPSPNLDHPLDFSAMATGATDPAKWPAPYDERPGAATELKSIGSEHFVRMRSAIAPAAETKHAREPI